VYVALTSAAHHSISDTPDAQVPAEVQQPAGPHGGSRRISHWHRVVVTS
jgi:hypothetical protein